MTRIENAIASQRPLDIPHSFESSRFCLLYTAHTVGKDPSVKHDEDPTFFFLHGDGVLYRLTHLSCLEKAVFNSGRVIGLLSKKEKQRWRQLKREYYKKD